MSRFKHSRELKAFIAHNHHLAIFYLGDFLMTRERYFSYSFRLFLLSSGTRFCSRFQKAVEREADKDEHGAGPLLSCQAVSEEDDGQKNREEFPRCCDD